MAFNVDRAKYPSKGKIVPMYLTEEGDLFPLVFDSEYQLDLVSTMIDNAMDHNVVVDTRTMINDPREKLSFRFEDQ